MNKETWTLHVQGIYITTSKCCWLVWKWRGRKEKGKREKKNREKREKKIERGPEKERNIKGSKAEKI